VGAIEHIIPVANLHPHIEKSEGGPNGNGRAENCSEAQDDKGSRGGSQEARLEKPSKETHGLNLLKAYVAGYDRTAT